MNLKKKSKEGLKWSFIETIGVRLFSVSTYFILAKLLDPVAFGLVALTNTFIFFSEIFVEQGFVAALIQKKGLEDKHLYSAFWGNVAMGVLLFLLTYVGSPWIALLYDEPLLTLLLRVHAITYIVSSFTKVHLALLQKSLEFKKVAISRTVAITVSCVASIVLAYQGYGVWSLVLQQVIFNFLQSVLLWFMHRWYPRFEFSWTHYKTIFSFGSVLMLNHFMIYLIRYTDTLLIGYFLGTAPLGYYSFAQKIFVTLTDLINLTFNKVMFSVFSLIQDQKDELTKKFIKFVDLLSLVSFPLFTLTFVFTPSAVSLLFGEKWMESVPIIQFLSLAGILVCLHTCFNQLLAGIGRVGLNLRIKVFYFFVILILMLVAVQFSVEFVAAMHVVAIFLTFAVTIFFSRKFIKVSLKQYLSKIISPLIASITVSALAYASFYFIQEVSLPVLILQVVLSVAAYLGYLFLTRPSLLDELKSTSGKN